MARRSIIIVGGGTAGWLTAAYLARHLELSGGGLASLTLVESPDVGIIGVGEGTFPTIRNTLRFLGIDETKFVRETSATFKQGICFADWLHAPKDGRRHHFFHPFEAPFYTEGTSLVPYWLLKDSERRPPFAQAVTIQDRVAASRRAPKRPHEGDYDGPLNYAYHIDAYRLGQVLAERARELGVIHVQDELIGAEIDEAGAIDHLVMRDSGPMKADLYVDCTGFRAELIGRALGTPFRSAQSVLFVDRAVACKVPYARTDAPLESYTIATAHEAGWTWDIGLSGARGVGCVYSSDHLDDDRAVQILLAQAGVKEADLRRIPFESGYRESQWVRNCVAVGLAGGFLEPLESTGIVLIEAAAGMIAELFPHNGPIDAPARRFNELITARFDNIVNFLKLHYCLSRRDELFWRQNRAPETIPDRLRELLDQWRYRPPGRFDFILDLESFAFFNYQYILYGMEYETDLTPVREEFPNIEEAERIFARIRNFGERAASELPEHRMLIQQIQQANASLLAS